MPVGKNAIDQFRGTLTIPDIMYPCTLNARRQWKGRGGLVMPSRWWLDADTQKEALAKRAKEKVHKQTSTVEKKAKKSTVGKREKQAKALEWQRRKEEAENRQYLEEMDKKRLAERKKQAQQEAERKKQQQEERVAAKAAREAAALKEASVKRHPLSFNRAGAVSLSSKIYNYKRSTLEEKEKQAKALEWQRRKEEAEYFEYHGMSKEEAKQKYQPQKTVKKPPRPIEVRAQFEVEEKRAVLRRAAFELPPQREEEKKAKKRSYEETHLRWAKAEKDRALVQVGPKKVNASLEALLGGKQIDTTVKKKKTKKAVTRSKRKRVDTSLSISSTITKKTKSETSIKKAKKRQGFTFTITKPETGKFGLIVRDLKVSYDGNINCTTEVESIASGSVFGDTPLKSGMALEFINGCKCYSYKRAVELLQKASGEIKIIATLYA